MPTLDPCTHDIDPLKLERDGTDQAARRVAALDPSSAPVDDRTTAHGIVFAREYSKLLSYFTVDNNGALDEVDTWAPFFGTDVAVHLAVAATQDLERYKSIVQERLAFLEDVANDEADATLIEHLTYLFAYPATFALQLDALVLALPTTSALRATIVNLIKQKLAPALRRLIGYYKADLDVAPADRVTTDALPTSTTGLELLLFGVPASSFRDVIDPLLSTTWIVGGAADWATYEQGIDPDPGVYGAATGTIFERANHIATHNLFTGALDEFLRVYARVVQDAMVELETSLTSVDDHAPHYALFLAFLELLKYARDDINTITERHLDFYYREVLQLQERGATPSRAHLVVELTKGMAAYELAAGTSFKAGKDALGLEAYFASDRAHAANRAVVTSLKKLYGSGTDLYVAPIANSDDGVSADLTSADLSWHPFVNEVYVDGELDSIAMTRATPGFAIASHYLALREGVRSVTLTLTVSGYSGAAVALTAGAFLCRFSGEKGWIDATPKTVAFVTTTSLQLTVELAGDADAVVAYNAATHGFDFDAAAPMMVVRLVNTEEQPSLCSTLRDVLVSDVTIDVAVDRVRTLTLSNDFGPVDASKPFQPFGAQPEADSALIVGSQEIFSKNGLSECTLHITWKNIPSGLQSSTSPLADVILPKGTLFIEGSDVKPTEVDLDSYEWFASNIPGVTVSFLKEGKWSNVVNETLFEGTDTTDLEIQPTSGTFNKLDTPGYTTDAAYTTATKTGYVRIALWWGMGHVAYRDALAEYLLKVAAGTATDDDVKPIAPYTPEIVEVYASYSATQTIDLSSADEEKFGVRAARFYHVTDFGQAEQHPYLKLGAPDTAIYLLPQFRHRNVLDEAKATGEAVLHQGELYIGVTGLVPPQTLTLLFQVADGTANPLATKPEPHLHWSYLRANEWIPFEGTSVEDATDELLVSGIVSLAVPRDATSNNTLMPKGLHWIRVAAAERTDAVNRLVAVVAQAVGATFVDAGNDPAFPASVLPAGTITKLAQSDAAVKKVTQPYATFGGSGAEESIDFYARISERLRHKDRAITLWDFEHLVLQAFPGIHRVKCLNHTHYESTDDGSGVYRERAPGHVTIVTIPDQSTSNPVNPLKPYTSLAVLEQIEEFLEERMTCFATLHVCNPKFEELRVHFTVRLHDGYDESLSKTQLQEAITRFLSPWAFSGYGNPSFGGKIHQSVLINFVEEQPCVDYLIDFKLYHDIDDKLGTTSLLEASGSTAVSILVSAPASKHEITVIDPDVVEETAEQCGCAA